MVQCTVAGFLQQTVDTELLSQVISAVAFTK